jgi:hypothetical protein
MKVLHLWYVSTVCPAPRTENLNIKNISVKYQGNFLVQIPESPHKNNPFLHDIPQHLYYTTKVFLYVLPSTPYKGPFRPIEHRYDT